MQSGWRSQPAIDRENAWNTLTPAQHQQIAADQAQQDRAMAECAYVAKSTRSNYNTGWGAGWVGAAITNSFADLTEGVVAGQNCVDYYRSIGVIR